MSRGEHIPFDSALTAESIFFVYQTLWPCLRMTQQELQYNAPYSNFNGTDDNRPGVLCRIYAVQLKGVNAVPGESSITSVQFIPSGRRTIVNAVSFSGDLAWWVLSIRKESGEVLVNSAPVPTLLNLAQSAGTNMSSNYTTSTLSLYLPNSGPFQFDPGVELIGNQVLILEGGFDPSKIPNATNKTVLNIAFFCWEYPNWGPTGTLPLASPGSVGAPAAGIAGIGGEGLRSRSPVSPAAIAQARARTMKQFTSKQKGVAVPRGKDPWRK